MELCFAHPHFLIFLSLFMPLIFLLKYRLHKPKNYKYPLANFLKTSSVNSQKFKLFFMSLLKVATFILAGLLISRPQWKEQLTDAKIDGIDIVLGIDVSASMEFVDDLRDPRTRIDVAKKQAQNFVEKRTDDQIGVVVFGVYAMTIAPITFDKNLLNQVISRMQIHDIEATSTNLSEGLALAISRLKNSKAKSKIVVLLTDGQPTGPTEISIEKAIQLAKELDVKVYTIGVGGDDGGYIQHFPGSYYKVSEQGVDFELLNKISSNTGGQTFKAKNPKEIEDAYKQIDLLEKTTKHADQYFSYNDIFWPIVGTILALIFLTNFLQAFVWRGVW